MSYFVRGFVFALLVVALLVPTVAVLAQDGEPVPAPTVPITLEEAAALLLSAITAIVVAGLGSAPITVFLVSIAKRLPFLEGISAQTIQLFVGGVLTALLWLARYFGVEVQFNSLVDLIVQAGPVVIAFLGTLGFSSAYYHRLRAANAPLVGYSRSSSMAQLEVVEAVELQSFGTRPRQTVTNYFYEDQDRPPEL